MNFRTTCIIIVAVLIIIGSIEIYYYQKDESAAKAAAIVAELGFDPDVVLAYEIMLVTPEPKIYQEGQWVTILNQKPGAAARRILQTTDVVTVLTKGSLLLAPRLLSQSGITQKPATFELDVGNGTVDKLVRQTALARIAAAKQKEKKD